ncbi:hypothetical protein LWI28_017486 [Acer negundo]|uniref:Ubiquitin-like protease family profile domain-containing protein n=1 Tax=Acer negundo TaxID=4023 RepID=A0AAD5P615_ACENE|nr:hypothetical protein LWI28_017486 [Acer negundo]
MAVENKYREENQNVTENVNVSEAENQPEYVNVAENVAEADNLAVVRYVRQNDKHIQQTKNVVQNEHASDNEDLDQYLVIVPCNVESSHWVCCVVRLHEWEITIYDSNAPLLPDNPRYRQEQVLPLRRLFPLICNKSGYYDMSKCKNRGLAYMKAVRLPPYRFPCQVNGSSCGAFMLKGIKYIMMGKEPNFNFVQQDIPGFKKQFARDIFANSLEP